MYSIYAIRITLADKIYIGQTKDIVERMKLHSSRTFKGYASKFQGKWELIYSESVASRSEALKREKQLKSGTGDCLKNHLFRKIKRSFDSGVAQW